MKTLKGFFIIFSICGLSVSRALPETIDVSPQYTDKAGEYGTSLPFRVEVSVAQFLYSGSMFAGIPEHVFKLTSISFRLDEGPLGGPPSMNAVIPRLEVVLSTSTRTLANSHMLYFVNQGPDATVVFSGNNVPLTGTHSGGAVNPFDVIIPFQTPFPYDRNANPLQVLIFVDGQITGGHDIDYGLDGLMRYNWGSLNPDIPLGGGPVTRFTYTQIPEPSVLSLGSLFMAWAMLKRYLAR